MCTSKTTIIYIYMHVYLCIQVCVFVYIYMYDRVSFLCDQTSCNDQLHITFWALPIAYVMYLSRTCTCKLLLFSSLCHTADMSVVSHSRHVCCVAQQELALCHTAGMSAVSNSRDVCFGKQQTCLLCHAADMCVVQHSRRWLLHGKADLVCIGHGNK